MPVSCCVHSRRSWMPAGVPRAPLLRTMSRKVLNGEMSSHATLSGSPTSLPSASATPLSCCSSSATGA
eukprot:scaffold388_cov244-Pinguiococcus_pyrenoidosus.AAC.13